VRLLIGLILIGALSAASVAATEQAAQKAAWANRSADAELPEQALLSIGLVEFEPGTLASNAPEGAMALRRAEARYIPYLLRRVIENSRLWGAVRFLPAADPSTELLVSGKVIESTGDRLVAQFKATDSTGREWLNREYTATAQLADYGNRDGPDPFLGLYRQVATDLNEFRSTLALEQLARIIEISRLRYAAAMAPDAFGNHLVSLPDGRTAVNRLPAAGDPMLARVERTRESEYLFIDTVDLQFSQYFSDLAPVYKAWRKLTLESGALMASYREKSSSRRARKGKNSLQRSYNELRELKLYEQSLREAISGFEFEVGPTTLDLDGELIELTGSLHQQHEQWKGLLGKIYAEEVGLPTDVAPAN
jgi:hypothetical protein